MGSMSPKPDGRAFVKMSSPSLNPKHSGSYGISSRDSHNHIYYVSSVSLRVPYVETLHQSADFGEAAPAAMLKCLESLQECIRDVGYTPSRI